MKKHIIILLVLAVVLATGVISWMQWRDYRRAIHNGRHAREWAWDYTASYDAKTRERAADALRALGSNAVPSLRKLLYTPTPAYERPLVQNARRIPFELRTNLFARLPVGQATTKRLSAAAALRLLGTNAAPAIPDLLHALRDESGTVRWAAAETLGRMGEIAVPVLMTAAADSDEGVRHEAIYALGVAGNAAAPATRLLMDHLTDTNQYIAASAQHSLSMVGTSALPDIVAELANTNSPRHAALVKVVTAIRPPNPSLRVELSRRTHNPSPAVRLEALHALENLRLTNPTSTAVFVRLLNDSDETVRRAATNALTNLTFNAASSPPQ